jgi:hypothetical protein
MRHGFWFERRAAAAILVAGLIQLSCSGAQPTTPSPAASSLAIGGTKPLGEGLPSVQLQLFQTINGGPLAVAATLAAWQSSNSGVATVSAGLVNAVSPGNTTISASYQGQSAATPLTVELDDDCISYGPPIQAISFTQDTPGWSIAAAADGVTALFSGADTLIDANNLVALYERYSQVCYIGRNNARPIRSQYILTYFKSSTGQQPVIAPQDCIPYNAAGLTTVNEGTSGWAVTSGGTQLALLDTSLEATVALDVAQQFSSECFIGRQNTRLNYYAYITEYWQ